ncbi:MAG TPA: anti-anti-sigma factor [Flavobacteriales bacterium]|nr:anti-anti-sigma factor [Flavobacteriales bacterium]HCA83367.1 anti-anti-sigma factor [Flavobacteriales bacterium]HRE75881.1 STAS domain-containing protein [Flavobacteriales bacterium]HRE97345.1 STAS domain-containing protein [Flavobacteriales bacterium]HRJ34403.1 STAS domain-containing protein [Flavobacteriales bacterium]
MNFEVFPHEKYVLIRSKVEKLDTGHAPELKSLVVFHNKEGVRNIIIDLSDTRYCDSSGLSSILVANRLCRSSNGSFVLTGLQEPVMKLITISQLHTVISITPTANEASDLVLMEEVERELTSDDENQ